MTSTIPRRGLLVGTSAAVGAKVFTSRGTRAQGTPPVIRLGVMSDYSGPYRDWSGPTNLACVQQAVEEFRAQRPDIPVEVINADHQKPMSAPTSCASGSTGVTSMRWWM